MAYPASADLEIYQGDTWAAEVVIIGSNGTAPPVITGYGVTAEIRYDTAEVVATIHSLITGPQTINISLTPAQTLPLCGTYVWDLQLSNAGVLTTILAGHAKVMPR